MKLYIIIKILIFGICFSACSKKTITDVHTSKTDNLKSDLVNTSDNAEFEIKAGLKPIDQTQNPYEIRFYKTEELSGGKTLKILYSTGARWFAKIFTELGDSIKVENLNMKYGEVRAASRVLFNSNLGYLPDQKKLETMMNKVEILNGRHVVKKHLVSDGQSYSIEFRHGDIYRIYRFNNPNIYSELYPDIQEFKDYCSIVEIFGSMVK